MLAACGGASMTALEAPAQIPKYKIDVDASEVRTIGVTDAAAIRRTGADALDSMVATRAGAAVPARFVAVVHASSGIDVPGVWGCAVPLALPTLSLSVTLLCPDTRWSTSLDLTLDLASGETLKATTEYSYTFKSGGPVEWSAIIHNAFQQAMMSAKMGDKKKSVAWGIRFPRGAQ